MHTNLIFKFQYYGYYIHCGVIIIHYYNEYNTSNYYFTIRIFLFTLTCMRTTRITIIYTS